MVHGCPDAAFPGPVERSPGDHRKDSPARSRKSGSLANPRRVPTPRNQDQRKSGKGNRGAAGKNPRFTESKKTRCGESQDRQAAPAETERREGIELSKGMARRGGDGEGG